MRNIITHSYFELDFESV
ncbi:hypothetical protein ACWIVU_10830 [Ursidibacter arcticus]